MTLEHCVDCGALTKCVQVAVTGDGLERVWLCRACVEEQREKCTDPTEMDRRQMVAESTVAAEADSLEDDPEQAARRRLEADYGQVWDTNGMCNDFVALAFSAPYVVVQRKSDGVRGTLMFQHSPRFYYNFKEDRK